MTQDRQQCNMGETGAQLLTFAPWSSQEIYEMKANVPHTLAELQTVATTQGLTIQEKYGRYRVVKKFSLWKPAIEWQDVVAGSGYSLSLDNVRNLLIFTDVERGKMMTGLKKGETKST